MDDGEGWPPLWGALGDLCVLATFVFAALTVASMLRDVYQIPFYIYPLIVTIWLGGVRWVVLMARAYRKT